MRQKHSGSIATWIPERDGIPLPVLAGGVDTDRPVSSQILSVGSLRDADEPFWVEKLDLAKTEAISTEVYLEVGHCGVGRSVSAFHGHLVSPVSSSRSGSQFLHGHSDLICVY